MLKRKIKIPKFLHEVHGHESSLEELIFNYITVLFVTGILVIMAKDLSLSTFKLAICVLLAIDLSGGVVSNFMEGTNRYYAESSKRRYIFISLHIIQPLLMYWIFPDEGINIMLMTLYTLSTMSIVNGIKKQERQRFLAAVFMMSGIALAFALNITYSVLLLMLVMFTIKLILSFAVRWR
ncbi:hypothetical protein QQ020_33035 [Fulvivirgaceae bacterium BMA12]|uniref:Uncharacterized protein n=1 Tax=Agaribacillus aureus TaxID=3051825 RepID=A0ABT8LGL9_9BACT|nr:hypothetical protein [Fulvivirgaceae bacterium BMA12]